MNRMHSKSDAKMGFLSIGEYFTLKKININYVNRNNEITMFQMIHLLFGKLPKV